MNSKQKNLSFIYYQENQKQIKDDKFLKHKKSSEAIHYEIKLVPPSCIKSSFKEDKWVGFHINKSRTSKDALNFTTIPSEWVEHVKIILCIIDQLPQHGIAKTSAFGSFSKYFSVYKHFFTNLDNRGIKELKLVTEQEIRKIYLSYSEGKSNLANAHYIKAIKKLYDYGPYGHKFLEDGLISNPSHDYLLRGNVKNSKTVGETAIIDEDTARLLIFSAIDWVINKKQDLLDLIELNEIHTEKKQSRSFLNRDPKQSLTLAQSRNTLHANKFYFNRLLEIRKNFDQNLVLLLDPAQQKSLEGVEPELVDFMKINSICKRVFRIYQAFTYVICASFTGWRASEIFSIHPETIKETATGFYLDSNLIKTTQNKNELISRPVPQIVVSAILNLQEIISKSEGLFNKQFNKNDDIKNLFKNARGNALDLKSLNEDLNLAWKYIGNNEFKFSTHQFRRFFAHFYIRRYQGTADAVRWNFRHISKDMILHYTSQAMNAKQLADSKKEFAMEIVNKIVQDNQYTSIGIGNELKDLSHAIKCRAKILTVEEASKYIEEKIEAEFKDIHAMEWGYCIFQNGYKGAVCEAKTGPIESRAEPSTCGRCKFLCTGQEHIGFWQQTVLLHQDISVNKFATNIMKKESEKVILLGLSILKRHGEKE